MKKLENLLKHYWIWILILLVIPSVVSLLHKGFYGASDEVHIAWLYEFHQAILAGKIPPRFVPDLSFGFGYPLFNFVFPLPFYLGEMFYLAGFSLVYSIKAVLLLSTILAMFGMFLLLKEFSDYKYALLGSLVYTYAPYRATNLYVRGAIGEVVALSLFPFIFLYVYRQLISKSTNKSNIALGGIAIGFLVLSHNIASYMFLPYVAFFVLLFLLFNKGSLKNLPGVFLQALLGLTISAFFWIPALLESKLVKYSTVFNYIDHFPTLRQLVTPYFGYGASVAGPYDGMSFFVGFAYIATMVIIFAIVISKWQWLTNVHKTIALWLGISLLTTFFMMNHRSSFLWELLPFLKYFQFPWRFLMVITFCVPLGVAVLSKQPKSNLLFMTIFTFSLFSIPYFRPQDFQLRDDNYYLAKYIPKESTIDTYNLQQEEYLRLPVDTQERPGNLYEPFFGELPSNASVNRLNSFDATLELTLTAPTMINYNKYNYPGWHASNNGNDIGITSGSPYGQISVDLPVGEHILSVYYKESGYKLFLDILSLVTFTGLIYIGLQYKNVKE